VNNAGILDFTELQDQSDARIAEMVNTNVTALIQLTRAALPDFLATNQGHFVMIGSILAHWASRILLPIAPQNLPCMASPKRLGESWSIPTLASLTSPRVA